MTHPDPSGGQGGPPSDDNAKLPHDRDESSKGGTADAPNPQHDQNRAVGRQALKDVESPMQDTDRHGTPNDVPSSTDNGK